MHLSNIALPPVDSAIADSADQVARRYCSPPLYAHSVRSYLWGVAYAQRQGLELDVELFYVAAMLHDLGLCRPFDAHEMPFEAAGGQVAWVLGAGAEWSPQRRGRVAEVIERHMLPSVDPAVDVEGHVLEVSTGIDVSGRGIDLIPEQWCEQVMAAWPRLALASEFAECLRLQGERKPTSRAADLIRGGVAEALRRNPLEGSPT